MRLKGSSFPFQNILRMSIAKPVFNNGWDAVLTKQFDSGYFKELSDFLEAEYKNNTVYPKIDDVFNCFKLTPYESVKVVILGQDPYHGEGQAQRYLHRAIKIG
jgi:uracil-DNA glycosylase